jgi:hypothetical protein
LETKNFTTGEISPYLATLDKLEVPRDQFLLAATAFANEQKNGAKLFLWKILLLFILTDSMFYRQFPLSIFPPNIDASLLRSLNFLGSASILYKLLYRPLFFSNILDSI